MDRTSLDLTRRRALLLGGSATAALAGGWPTAALAQGSTLRAGITGYNVINTLDPGKATLIPEFYVIWGLYNALMKFSTPR
jgi:peptide/nickel transport system substrate-binding protein